RFCSCPCSGSTMEITTACKKIAPFLYYYRMNKYLWIGILLMRFILISQGEAQDVFGYNADVEQSFSMGLTLFREKNFSEAAILFDSLSRMSPIHQRTTASFVMAAKARFIAGAYQESATGASVILKKFPGSEYIDDARFTLALDYMM